MSGTRLSIQFGALALPLQRQLKDQGVEVGPENVMWLQRYADAITLLKVRALLTDREAARARKRLLQELVKACSMEGMTSEGLLQGLVEACSMEGMRSE